MLLIIGFCEEDDDESVDDGVVVGWAVMTSRSNSRPAVVGDCVGELCTIAAA